MDDPDGYFGEPVAASYDDPSDRMFQPEVAEHPTAGGCFVIETAIPDLRQLPPGQDILGYRAGPGRIVSYSFNHATQQYRGHYVEFTAGTGSTGRSRSATHGHPSLAKARAATRVILRSPAAAANHGSRPSARTAI